MNITEITARAGAHKRRRRVGRGESSGHGRTSGRGNKGAGQRQSWRLRLFHEGGAFPLFRRVAKRGFNNQNFRVEYRVINVGELERAFAAGQHVTAAALVDKGLVRAAWAPLKVLGNGDLKIPLTIEAERFSGSAVQKIEAAGGTVKRLGPQPKKKFVKRPPPPPPRKEETEQEGKGAKKAKGGKEGKPAKEGKEKPRKDKGAPESPAPEKAASPEAPPPSSGTAAGPSEAGQS